MKKVLIAIGLVAPFVASQECAASGQQCGELTEGVVTGCCDETEACNFHFPFYSECGKPLAQCKPKFTQCGGEGYTGETQCCDVDGDCVKVSSAYSECRPLQYALTKQNCDTIEGVGEDNLPNVDASGFALEHGRLSVDGVQLVDEAGEPIQLKGMNVNRVPTTDCNGLDAMTHVVENWGVNMLRVGIDDWAYMQNQSTVELLYEQIDQAMSLGIYVVAYMNNGQASPFYYINGEGSETGSAVTFHVELAERYADSSQFILDLYNELWSGNWVEGWQEMKDFTEFIVPAIREVAPETVIFVPTNFWNQNFHVVRTNRIQNETVSYNLMYKYSLYTGSHDIYLGRLIKYGQLVPLIMPKVGISEWFSENLYRDFMQEYFDVFDQFNMSYAVTDMTQGGMNAIWRPGTCESKDWTNLTCTGVLFKSQFVEGSMIDQCAATTEQCGGRNFVGAQHCCSEDDTCVVSNETYSECQSLGYTCAAANEQCSGLDINDESMSKGCCNPQDVCTAVTDSFSHCVTQELPVECPEASFEKSPASALGFATTTGKLKAENNRIVDLDGNVVQLRGVSSDIFQTGSPCLSLDKVSQVVNEWGINALRIPVGADSITDEVLSSLYDTVKICDDLGIYCVVAYELQSNGSPMDVYEDATSFWNAVGEELGRKDNLIFELLSGSFATNNDLEDFYNIRSFTDDYMPTFRTLTENLVFLGVSNGFDVYMPHAEHIDSDKMVNVSYSAKFYAGSDRDVQLIDSFSVHTDRRGIMISELHFGPSDQSAGLYANSAQRLIDVLDMKKISYFLASFSDDTNGLVESCASASLEASCAGQVAQATVATSAQRLDNVEESSTDSGEGTLEDDEDDEMNDFILPIGLGVVILALVAFIVTRKTRDLDGSAAQLASPGVKNEAETPAKKVSV